MDKFAEGKSFAWITNRLLLTSKDVAEDKAFLGKNGVTHILNLTGTAPNSEKPRFPNKFPKEFKYLHICKRDESDTDIKEYCTKGVDFIAAALKENKSNKVLVHCFAGISRSSTTVICYLMKHEKMRLKDAYLKTKKSKTNIGPNAGFFKQLIAIEKALVTKNGGTFPDSKSITVEEYLTDQMTSKGGIFSSQVEMGTLKPSEVLETLKKHKGNVQLAQAELFGKIFGA
mmetsp:Transcript_11305/g.16899  ORF Transcript_11305/g.16899 Transcript_11305/m.16899 type:complete len:229 (-) Transcript_11305:68-754(-)